MSLAPGERGEVWRGSSRLQVNSTGVDIAEIVLTTAARCCARATPPGTLFSVQQSARVLFLPRCYFREYYFYRMFLPLIKVAWVGEFTPRKIRLRAL